MATPDLSKMNDSEELRRLGRVVKLVEGMSVESLRWLSQRVDRLIETSGDEDDSNG